MAIYNIQWKSSAIKELRKLSKKDIPFLIEAIEQLGTNPRPPQVKKIAGASYTYRIRVRDYRIIYSIEDTILLIEIIRIGHRKDVYR